MSSTELTSKPSQVPPAHHFTYLDESNVNVSWTPRNRSHSTITPARVPDIAETLYSTSLNRNFPPSPNPPHLLKSTRAKAIELTHDKARIYDSISDRYDEAVSGRTNPHDHALLSYVKGPLGSQATDVFLKRAVDAYSRERNLNPPADIVILGKRDISCNNLARRLLDCAPAQLRAELKTRIEVLYSTHTKKVQGEYYQKPRIIIISEESLGRAKADKKTTSNLNGLRDYISRAGYLYFDRAESLASDGKQTILTELIDLTKSNGVQGKPVEIIGTGYSNNAYSVAAGAKVRSIKSILNGASPYYIDSPADLTADGLTPKLDLKNPVIEEINREISDDSKSGKATHYRFSRDFANNREAIESLVLPCVQEAIKKGSRRIIIRTYQNNVDAIDTTLKILGKAGITACNIDYRNKSTAERMQLLDNFGVTFNVLVHCQILDEEDIPADALIVYTMPRTDDKLEAIMSSTRTPYANAQDEKTRTIYLFSPGEATSETPDPIGLLQAIEQRHYSPNTVQTRALESRSSATDTKATEAVPVEVNQLAIEDESLISVYGSNPQWVEYWQKNILKDKTLEALIEDLKPLCDGVSEDEINNTLQGDVEGIKPDAVREVINYALLTCNQDEQAVKKELIEQFPHIMGINNNEAGIRVAYIVAQDVLDSKSALSIADQARLSFLDKMFGSREEVWNFIGNFINKQNPDILYDDYRLARTSAILLGAGLKSQNSDVLEKQFVEALKADDRFNVVDGVKIFPNQVQFGHHINSIEQARKVVTDLNQQGLISINLAWRDALQKRMGFSNIENTLTLVADFIFGDQDLRSLYCQTPDRLAQAVSAILDPSSTMENSHILRQRFFNEQINKANNHRITALEFNSYFPGTVNIADDVTSEAIAIKTVEYLQEHNPPASNANWLNVLNTAVGNKANEAIARFLFRDRNGVFTSEDSLSAAIAQLQGHAVAESDSNPDPNLPREFYAFVNEYYTPGFIATEIDRFFPGAADLTKLSTDETRLARTIEYELKVPNNIKNNPQWNKLLDTALTKRERGGEAIAKRSNIMAAYLIDQKITFENIETLKENISILVGERRSRTITASERSFFSNFVRFIERQTGHTFNPLDVSSAVNGLYENKVDDNGTASMVIARLIEQREIAIKPPLSADLCCEYLLANDRTIFSDTRKLETRLRSFAQGTQNTEEPKEPSAFYTWLYAKQPQPCSALMFRESLPNRGVLFEAKPLIQTRAVATREIEIVLNGGGRNLNTAWLSKLPNTSPYEAIADFLLAQTDLDPFGSSTILRQYCRLLLGDSSAQVSGVDINALRKNFYTHLYTQYPNDFNRIAAIELFPEAIPLNSEIASLDDAIKITKTIIDENATLTFPSYLVEASASDEARIRLIATRLYIDRDDLKSFEDLTRLRKLIRIAMCGDVDGISQAEGEKLLGGIYDDAKVLNPELDSLNHYNIAKDNIALTDRLIVNGVVNRDRLVRATNLFMSLRKLEDFNKPWLQHCLDIFRYIYNQNPTDPRLQSSRPDEHPAQLLALTFADFIIQDPECTKILSNNQIFVRAYYSLLGINQGRAQEAHGGQNIEFDYEALFQRFYKFFEARFPEVVQYHVHQLFPTIIPIDPNKVLEFLGKRLGSCKYDDLETDIAPLEQRLEPIEFLIQPAPANNAQPDFNDPIRAAIKLKQTREIATVEETPETITSQTNEPSKKQPQTFLEFLKEFNISKIEIEKWLKLRTIPAKFFDPVIRHFLNSVIKIPKIKVKEVLVHQEERSSGASKMVMLQNAKGSEVAKQNRDKAIQETLNAINGKENIASSVELFLGRQILAKIGVYKPTTDSIHVTAYSYRSPLYKDLDTGKILEASFCFACYEDKVMAYYYLPESDPLYTPENPVLEHTYTLNSSRTWQLETPGIRTISNMPKFFYNTLEKL